MSVIYELIDEDLRSDHSYDERPDPSEYKILNRAVFYVGRLLSSEKERDFTGSDYDAIKSVYSTWICMNKKENALATYIFDNGPYPFTKEALVSESSALTVTLVTLFSTVALYLLVNGLNLGLKLTLSTDKDFN